MEEIKFGTDGIRGTAGEWPIDSLGALKIGGGLGTFLTTKSGERKVIIGRDTRLSGDMLSKAVSSGLLSQGIDVIDVGIITTAGIAFLVAKFSFDAGVVISASHNPWTQNGIKIIGSGGLKFAEREEIQLQSFIQNGHKTSTNETRLGKFEDKPELSESYIDHLISPFKNIPFSSIEAALDCSNGAASYIAPRCYQLLGCNPEVINASPDGKNINLDCGSEDVRAGDSELKQITTTHNLHFGAAFDGDADRVILVDSEGNLLDGDHILLMLAKHYKSKKALKGNVVVTTSMANRGLEKALSNHGIKTIRTKVGDKYILEEIMKNDYFLGGEQSGHILVFDGKHTTGDGIYTSLLVASLIIRSAKKDYLIQAGNELLKFPQVIASGTVSDKPDMDKMQELTDLKNSIQKDLGPEGIINIRYSGTEPVIRVMLESDNRSSVDQLAICAAKLCRAVQSHTGDDGKNIEIKDLSTGKRISTNV